MDGEYRGTSLGGAIRQPLHAELRKRKSAGSCLGKKGRFDVWAPPLFWGPWPPIWVSLGFTGPNQARQRTTITVTFDTVSDAPSPFGVEIKGGDKMIRRNGPGAARVTISGNHATTISIRCKSHSIGQQIVASI